MMQTLFSLAFVPYMKTVLICHHTSQNYRVELKNGFICKEGKNDQKEMREPAEKAAAPDVQQTGLNESRRQKKDDKGRKIVPNTWLNINAASTLKLMTSLNSKHLDMRSSNFSHSLLTHLDVLLCSQCAAFSFSVLGFLAFKPVLFQPTAGQRSGERLSLTCVCSPASAGFRPASYSQWAVSSTPTPISYSVQQLPWLWGKICFCTSRRYAAVINI